MKTKITFISVVTLSIALLLTSCSGKGTVSTTEPQNTTAEDSTASADNSNTKLDDLYQQENQIFAEHKDIWDKLFGLMNKNTADSNGNYADHLADTAESKNRSQKLKKKLQNPITMGKILILKMHHHSKISQVRISMVILLTKVFFPKMQ